MKSVLAIVPYENIYPPMSGGMLRCFHILHQLSIRFDVSVIMHQEENDFLLSLKDFPAIRNCKIYSTKQRKKPSRIFSLFPEKVGNALRYRYLNRTLDGPADTNFLLCADILIDLLKRQKFDFVFVEDTGLIMARLIRRCAKDACIIYNSYNVETTIALEAYEKGLMAKTDYELIRGKEMSLYKWVNGMIACSSLDLKELIDLNKSKISGDVIPNGVYLPVTVSNHQNNEPGIENHFIFCGSLDYEPNREGLLWFCKEVLTLVIEQLPDAKLLVVGKGDPGKELAEKLQHGSIMNYGMVDNVDEYYKKAAVAIVPLLSGSGTRLKILEAMGRSVPVISTQKGAEGIEYTANENILIADENKDFAFGIVRLLKDRAYAANLGKSAYAFVKEKYDWNIIGNKLQTYLLHLEN